MIITLPKGYEKSALSNKHISKAVSGNQECRNLHDVGHSTGIRQAFRSSFFTNYDIM
jgi:hypothetical protein